MRIERAVFALIVIIAAAVVIVAPAMAAGDDIPRTANGKPDLTGRYNIASSTPFERNPRFGDKKYMAVEEAERIMAATAAAVARSNAASDPDRSAPPAGGDGSGGPAGAVGGYNAFWTDRGSARHAIDGQFQTSILTEPANGRMPELSEAGKARRADLHPYAYENTGDAWWIETGDDPYDGPETLSILDRCLYLSAAATPARPILYNNMKTITQTEDHVVILVEWMHWAKVVRLNGEHPPAEVRSLGGRFDRLVGRRHPGGRDDELPGQAGRSARGPQGDRALHQAKRRRDPLPVHRSRSRLHRALRGASSSGRRPTS